jgi:hypothetical protein
MGFVIVTILLLFSLIFVAEALRVWGLNRRISAVYGLAAVAMTLLTVAVAAFRTQIF